MEILNSLEPQINSDPGIYYQLRGLQQELTKAKNSPLQYNQLLYVESATTLLDDLLICCSPVSKILILNSEPRFATASRLLPNIDTTLCFEIDVALQLIKKHAYHGLFVSSDYYDRITPSVLSQLQQNNCFIIGFPKSGHKNVRCPFLDARFDAPNEEEKLMDVLATLNITAAYTKQISQLFA